MVKHITTAWSVLFTILVCYLIFDSTVRPANQSETSQEHTPADTNVSLEDQLAIKNVVDAYAFYWDSNKLDKFLDLFLDDAVGVSYGKNGEQIIKQIKSPSSKQNAQDRMTFFRENEMQRRHMMSSTFFVSQSDDHAEIKQYAMLLSTNKKSKLDSTNEVNFQEVRYETKIISPIIYTFELKKINGLWKISRRKMEFDRPLDLALSRKANSSQ